MLQYTAEDPVLPDSLEQYILANVRGEQLCAVVARSLLVLCSR